MEQHLYNADSAEKLKELKNKVIKEQIVDTTTWISGSITY